MSKILGFDGSGRKDSMNRKLLKIVAQEAEAAGAEITLINLHDYNLPIYNGDLESQSGLPEKVIELKKLFGNQDGFLIASPEFNGGYSALLKNTIDWVTRPAPEDISRQPFAGSTIGLITATPGPLSGLRGLNQLNSLFFGINATVLPTVVAIGNYGDAFNDDGSLKQEKHIEKARKLGQQIIKATS